MKHAFIKFIAVVSLTVAAASAQAEVVTPGVTLDSPVALSLSTANLLTPAVGAFVTPTGLFALDEFGSFALSVATTPARTWETFPVNATQAKLVPLPEPSSEAALYFLSGAVGLALVVMRRRTLA